MHAKLNELITNLNAQVRIWMLEKTLPGTVANLNALDAYFNLNDVNAKFLDRIANLNDRNTNLNYGFHGQDLFREFEWLFHQMEWQICEIDRENLYKSAWYIMINLPTAYANSFVNEFLSSISSPKATRRQLKFSLDGNNFVNNLSACHVINSTITTRKYRGTFSRYS